MKAVRNNIEFYLISLIAFAIPLEKRFLPFVIATYLLHYLVTGNLRDKFRKMRQTKYVWFTTIYYTFLILGCTYSSQMDAAYFDLEVKFSLLIFPIMMSSLEMSKKQYVWVLNWFIIGCFIAFIICLSYALFFYYSTQDATAFFYYKLSVFHHPTYFSMYLNFAILILYYYLIFDKENFIFKSGGLSIALIIVFSLFIVLLSSKIGLITLLFIIFVGTFFWFIRSLAIFQSILILLILASMIYVSFKYSPIIQARAQEAVVSLSGDTKSQSTTGARLIIWDISYDLIQAKPLMGYGTGDVKYELVKKYQEFNYEHLYEGKLNAHNQYLQMLLAIGIIGSIFFWLYLYYPMIKLNLFRNFVFLGFIILITFNFLTESMLETQAGVIFYAFFNALLYFNQEKIVQLNFKRT